MTYYKATRPDGTDFRTGTVDYGAALVSGGIVRHPHGCAPVRDDASTYLSISTTATGTMIGGSWPCRLFEVEPVEDVLDGLSAHPHKRATSAMHVVREVDAWRVLGPNGRDVVSIIEAVGNVEWPVQHPVLDAAWYAARGAAWNAARDVACDAACDAARDAARDVAWYAAWDAACVAAWNAARDIACDAARHAAWDAARNAARGAILGIIAQDLISDEHFNILMREWRFIENVM